MQPLSITFDQVLTFPALPLEHLSLLPESAGLYFAIARHPEPQLLYIGKAQNFRDRWKAHHRLRDLLVIAAIGVSVSLAWLELSANDAILLAYESKLIRQFNPPLNHLQLPIDPTIRRLEQATASQINQLEMKLTARMETIAAQVTSLEVRSSMVLYKTIIDSHWKE